MKEKVAEFIKRKKYYLPIEIQTIVRRTRTKTSTLIPDGDAFIIKTVMRSKKLKMIPY